MFLPAAFDSIRGCGESIYLSRCHEPPVMDGGCSLTLTPEKGRPCQEPGNPRQPLLSATALPDFRPPSSSSSSSYFTRLFFRSRSYLTVAFAKCLAEHSLYILLYKISQHTNSHTHIHVHTFMFNCTLKILRKYFIIWRRRIATHT